jgi:nicotinic acid mononucleotide adenylyltransferase
MHLPDPVALLESLNRTDARLAMIATGGGSLAIPHLLTTPGASSAVVEALVPYARESVDRLLGGPQESYCSSRTARRLAMAAWQRTRGLHVPPKQAMGAAVACSLRTLEPKRGEHRIFAATQTIAATVAASIVLEKNARSRGEEEKLAAALLLELVGQACSGQVGRPLEGLLRPGERVESVREEATPEWQELLAGRRRAVCVGPADSPTADETAPARLIFPGSFDPLHEGHRLMARIAEEIAERPVEFELSIENVDKPCLDYVELRARSSQFAGQSLWLTRAATFLEKLLIFPRSTFVLGADTFVRLADPRYYGGSQEAADRAVQTIAENAGGLIVFGRIRDGVFEEPGQLRAPQTLRDIAYFVSQREFRLDISSTDLRRERLASERP